MNLPVLDVGSVTGTEVGPTPLLFLFRSSTLFGIKLKYENHCRDVHQPLGHGPVFYRSSTLLS